MISAALAHIELPQLLAFAIIGIHVVGVIVYVMAWWLRRRRLDREWEEAK